MKKIAAYIAALAVVLTPFRAMAAPATTLVFVGSEGGADSIAAVRQGVFTKLDWSSDERGRLYVQYQFGDGEEEKRPLRGLTLHGYNDGVEGIEVKVIGVDDNEMALNSVLKLDGAASNLISSTPLRSAGASPAATPADLAAARALVKPLLARLAVPRRAWRRVLDAVKVQPVRIRAHGAPVLVIEGKTDLFRTKEDGEDRALGYLLVAERTAKGWTPALQRTYFGGAVCRVTSWEYRDHADLDADGTDELVIATEGWESYHSGTIVRRTPEGRWHGTGAGELDDGEGC